MRYLASILLVALTTAWQASLIEWSFSFDYDDQAPISTTGRQDGVMQVFPCRDGVVVPGTDSLFGWRLIDSWNETWIDWPQPYATITQDNKQYFMDGRGASTWTKLENAFASGIYDGIEGWLSRSISALPHKQTASFDFPAYDYFTLDRIELSVFRGVVNPSFTVRIVGDGSYAPEIPEPNGYVLITLGLLLILMGCKKR